MFWLPVVLLYLRLQSGMSQSQLAANMHTNRIYISKVECGTRPTLYSFERYADGLDVPMDKIVRMCELLAAGGDQGMTMGKSSGFSMDS